MSKSIYELGISDTYWFKDTEFWEPTKVRVLERRTKVYKKDLECGNVFLTKEECQASIDYDKALAKIKKRAWELGINLEKDFLYKLILCYEELSVNFADIRLNRIEEDEYYMFVKLIGDLKEEFETVLGVK